MKIENKKALTPLRDQAAGGLTAGCRPSQTVGVFAGPDPEAGREIQRATLFVTVSMTARRGCVVKAHLPSTESEIRWVLGEIGIVAVGV